MNDKTKDGRPIGLILDSKLYELDDTWVECKGQIIKDKDSPFYGLNIPPVFTVKTHLCMKVKK